MSDCIVTILIYFVILIDSSSNTKTVLPPNVVIPAATARSTTTKITARAYDEISMKLQAKLSEEEERNADFRGMQWRMLLAWYLTVS